jgi:LysM repeat protein
MEKRTSAFARIFAAIALIGAVVVVIAVISGSLGGGSGSSTRSQHGSGHTAKQSAHRTRAASYVVKSGDTLVSIAHMTGVPVAEIQKLNPEVDPQILIAGEKLKLR